MAEYPRTNTATTQANSYGINREQREQMLLDDLRIEVARLADAVERQNELLSETTDEVDR